MNVTKVQSHVMLELRFVRLAIKCEKKNKGTTEYDKSTITCDVGTVQSEDSTIKFEKKIRELPNVTKIQSHVMLVLRNVWMVPSNVRNK